MRPPNGVKRDSSGELRRRNRGGGRRKVFGKNELEKSFQLEKIRVSNSVRIGTNVQPKVEATTSVLGEQTETSPYRLVSATA